MTTKTNINPFQKPHELTAYKADPRQRLGNRPFLLQLPLEILQVIGEFVSTSNTGDKVEASKNAVRFGRVCALIHIITHSKPIDTMIREAVESKKHWVKDVKNPNNQKLVDLSGRVWVSVEEVDDD